PLRGRLTRNLIYSTKPNEYGMSNEKIEEIRAKLHKLNRNVGLY
ncbi:TPA: hypothetical protein ACH1KP_005615, partial [Klebsiella pneumoniae]